MPAPNPKSPPSIEIRVDERLQRTSITLRGPVSGPKLGSALVRLLTETPQTAGHDFLYELREYTGDVCAADIQPVAEAYARCPQNAPGVRRTAFVTPDPNFELWAAAFDHQFPGRKHEVFASMDAALAFLGETAVAA